MSRELLLVVDDEPAILTTLAGVLSDEGFNVRTASSGNEGLEAISQSLPALVLLDIWMPGLDGIETLKKIREQYPNLLVIMMSGHGSIETAVKAIKLGAYDYIEKPLTTQKVLLVVRHALNEQRLARENLTLREEVERRFEMVGEGPAMRRLKEQILTAGPSNSRVLISGENGTGKELVARAIHLSSPRHAAPFVEINCAAIPESLIENELFGHERGAFTGALAVKKGKFEGAEGGTLFLDEIGDMSLPTQARVLRVLQEQEFHRVGGTGSIRVDARVIAASNKNLQEEIKRGAFREDLFYRLNVIPLAIPPLRERKEDIPLLVCHFISETAREQRLPPKEIAADALEIFNDYAWPGNIRELKNIVERLMIMVPRPVITAGDLPLFLEMELGETGIPAESSGPGRSLREARAAFEKNLIMERLRENGWNVNRAAEDLGIERTYLYRKMKALGIDSPPDRSG